MTRNGTGYDGSWLTHAFVTVLYGATLTGTYAGAASGSVAHNAGDQLLSLVAVSGKRTHETILANRLARMPVMIATTQLGVLEAEHETAGAAGSKAINVPATGNNARLAAAAYAGSLTP